MFRPGATYRALAACPPARPVHAALGRTLLLLLVVGGFVSFTSAGRLVAAHLALTALFWSFVPALQLLAVSGALASVAPDSPRARAFDLYLAGQGPWYLLLLFVSGVCLFAPDPAAVFFALLRSGALPVALLATAAWGVWLTFAAFRHGLGLRLRAAGLATGLHYAVYVGGILGYYFLTDQLGPLLFGPDR